MKKLILFLFLFPVITVSQDIDSISKSMKDSYIIPISKFIADNSKDLWSLIDYHTDDFHFIDVTKSNNKNVIYDSILTITGWKYVFPVTKDRHNDYCKIRGHYAVKISDIIIPKCYCKPFIIDIENISYIIYPPDHYLILKCLRCKRKFVEIGEIKYQKIWDKCD